MKHVVVDGSNIATEGREVPSLVQLDEAVRAFIDEYHPGVVTVVVDATFPNRVAAKERRVFEEAVAANELITPPAGAIGRGDAFVLQIADKANAVVLSNDSFQEFHGDYPWLFERSRLIGGKPVPHVGWVFMERSPVRGPTSRRAVSEAKKVARTAAKVAESAEKVAEAAEAAGGEAETPPPKKRRARRKPAAVPAEEAPTDGEPAATAGGVAAEAPGPDGETARRRGPARREVRATKGVEPYNDALPFIEFVSAHPVGSEVDATVERFSSHGAYVTVGEARGYLPLRNMGDPPPRSAKEQLELGQTVRLVVVAIDPPLRGIDLAVPGVATPAPPRPIDLVEAEMAEAAAEAGASPETGVAAARTLAGRAAAGAGDTGQSAGLAEPRRRPARGGRAAKKRAAERTPEEVAAARSAAAKKAAATRAAKRLAADESPAGTAGAGERRTEGAGAERAEATPAAAPARGRKAAAGKAAAKRVPAKAAPAKTAPAKQTAARKAPAKRAPARKKPGRKAAAGKGTAGKGTAEQAPAGRGAPAAE
ncbi:MAG TPA: S1 RNA-binding domain-containing protein [Acidimicrobiales bacterium]